MTPCKGQVWRSRDKRDDGLNVTVISVEPDRIQIQRFKKVWVRRDRFVSSYEFVKAGRS